MAEEKAALAINSSEPIEQAIKISGTKQQDGSSNDKKEIFEVGIGVTVQNIMDVHTTAQVFTCRAKFKLTYPATAEDIKSWEENDGANDPYWKPESFVPALLFLNAMTPPELSFKEDTPRFFTLRRDRNKAKQDPEHSNDYLIFYDFSCLGTFMEPFELRAFPFDCQDLTIFLQLDNGGGSNKYRFIPDPTSNEFSKFKLLYCVTTEFKIHSPMVEFGWTDAKDSKKGTVYPLFTIKLKMERNYKFYLIQVCGYLALLSLLSLCAFGIDYKESGDRLSVGFTMLVALIAYQLVVNDMLPNLEFLTFLDEYNLFATIFVGLVCAENAVFGFLERKGVDGDLEMIDDVMFILLALLWSVGQLWFFVKGRNLKSSEQRKLSLGTPELLDAGVMNKGAKQNNNDVSSYFTYRDVFQSNGGYQKLLDKEWVTVPATPQNHDQK